MSASDHHDFLRELAKIERSQGGMVVAAAEGSTRTKPIYWPPNATGDARQLPELRHALIQMAQDGEAWHHSELLRMMNELCGNLPGKSGGIEHGVEDGNLIIRGPKGYGPDELGAMAHNSFTRADLQMNWYRRNLADSQLIHVTSELCEVLFSSLDSMPDERVLQADDAPTPAGLCIFESPFTGIDSGSEFETCRVDGVLWGPVLLPPRAEWATSMASEMPGFAIAAFRWMDPINHLDENMRADLEQAAAQGIDISTLPRLWCSLGRTDWVVGDSIETPVHDGHLAGSKAHLSMMEDRKLIAALWALIAQKRLVERTTVSAPRHAAKRLERAGDRLSRDVEVIHLRRPEYRPTHADGSTGRKIGVRYAVRPFWRNQAYGPGWSEHRLILVPAHMRGPEGAPLSNIERVWEVDR